MKNNEFVNKLELSNPKQGQISLFWLGQAGFLIKNSKCELLAVDIYLSDLAEKQDGNKRLMMSILDPEDFDPDVILVTHNHTDHLDLDSLPVLLKKSSKLYCCKQSYEFCKKANLPINKITAMSIGDVIHEKSFTVEAVFADHGDASTFAVGFIIETEGVRIYFTGDSSYQHQRMAYAASKAIDILIVPINGEYGNMNECDAAMLAAQVNAKLTIPCHFWTFARHQGSPYLFQTEMSYTAPGCKEYTMSQGEMIYFPAE